MTTSAAGDGTRAALTLVCDAAASSAGRSDAGRLRRRPEFLAVARGSKYHGRAFTLQALRRGAGQGTATTSATATKVAATRAADTADVTANTAAGMTIDTAAGMVPVSVARFGFTVTRKEGSATERNRIRRRLRELVRTRPGLYLQGDHDYVLIGRREALGTAFDVLGQDLDRALAHVHGKTSSSKRPHGGAVRANHQRTQTRVPMRSAPLPSP
jgi:ribonuclease P protein component